MISSQPGGDPRRRPRDRDERGRPANARPRDRFGRPLPRGAPDELAGREEPEQVVSSVTEAFERGVALFDQQRFFEAHEFLEYVWKSAGPADRSLWKGVTQVAVGYCHVQRGNATGAVALLERAAAYLDACTGLGRGVDVTALRRQALEVAAAVRARGASPATGFPAFPRA